MDETLILALAVFKTTAEAEAWLRRPHPLLDGATPMEAAATVEGHQRVHDILNAIKYGGAV